MIQSHFEHIYMKYSPYIFRELQMKQISKCPYVVDLHNLWSGIQILQVKSKGDHSFSTYAKFLEKLTSLTPWYAHVRVRIRG